MGLLSCIEAEASQNTQYAGLKLESKGKLRDHERRSETQRTLMAMVRMAAMTSSDPPSTRLSGNEGSYSHIAVMVSTAAIFVMWLITAILAMLTT